MRSDQFLFECADFMQNRDVELQNAEAEIERVELEESKGASRGMRSHTNMTNKKNVDKSKTNSMLSLLTVPGGKS